MQASQLDYRVRFLGLAVVLLVASSKASFLVFFRFPPRHKIEESQSLRYSSILSDNASGSSVHVSSEKRKINFLYSLKVILDFMKSVRKIRGRLYYSIGRFREQ